RGPAVGVAKDPDRIDLSVVLLVAGYLPQIVLVEEGGGVDAVPDARVLLQVEVEAQPGEARDGTNEDEGAERPHDDSGDGRPPTRALLPTGAGEAGDAEPQADRCRAARE